MSQLSTSLMFLVVAVVAAIVTHRLRLLRSQLAQARLEAARARRHNERLEMVLKQVDPAIFAQVKARSDMEWQQASARLKEGELPAFFPLETAFATIDPLARAQ